MAIVSSSNGRYRIRACNLPIYVTLKKYGFRTMRVIVRYSTEKFTMRCLGMLDCYMIAVVMKGPMGSLLSTKEGKDQESIQSSTTPDPGYHWESDNFTIRHKK